MDLTLLLFIALFISLLAFLIEKHVSWVAYLSAVCIIILSALLLSTFKIIPQESPLYDFFLGPSVPITLACMILALNMKDLKQLPLRPLIIFAVGAIATMVGGIMAALFGFADQGPDAIKLAAQLTASYIGGGENAVAVQHMLNIDHEKFLACFAVDNVVTSIWMVLTIFGVRSYQNTHTSSSTSNNNKSESAGFEVSGEGIPAYLIDFLMTLTVALGCTVLAKWLSLHLGGLHYLLYLTIITVSVGQIPFLRPRLNQSYLLGSLAFAPFFFSMGAISDIHQLASISKTIILMPFIVVFTHGVIIYLLCKKWAPLDEISLTSQALVGGVGTSVALAQTCRWKEGISMGIILGTLGYAVANFLGMAVYHISFYLIRFI